MENKNKLQEGRTKEKPHPYPITPADTSRTAQGCRPSCALGLKALIGRATIVYHVYTFNSNSCELTTNNNHI